MTLYWFCIMNQGFEWERARRADTANTWKLVLHRKIVSSAYRMEQEQYKDLDEFLTVCFPRLGTYMETSWPG